MTGVLLAAPPSYDWVGECFLPNTASRSEPQHATGIRDDGANDFWECCQECTHALAVPKFILGVWKKYMRFSSSGVRQWWTMNVPGRCPALSIA